MFHEVPTYSELSQAYENHYKVNTFVQSQIVKDKLSALEKSTDSAMSTDMAKLGKVSNP